MLKRAALPVMLLGAIAFGRDGPAVSRPSSRAVLDIAYAHADDKQTLDLYVPETNRFATIFYVYDGTRE